jgi:prepilin-type N-terminal cleavage/methylation domain-containing protein
MRQRGFTLIELMIVIAIIAVIAAIAIPNLIEARKGANESSAISSLRTLVTVQSLFRDKDKDEDGAANYAISLEALEDAGLIDSVLSSGQKQGYFFQMNTDSSRFAWSATAKPAAEDLSGNRYFFVDESGVIRFKTDGEAGPSDTPVGSFGPDVAVQVRAAATAPAAEAYTFFVDVTNACDDVAPLVPLQVDFPSSVSVESFDPEEHCFSGSVNCTFENLLPGATLTVRITVRFAATGPIPFTAQVSPPSDANPGNNSASFTVSVGASGPDLAVTLLGPASATIDQPLTVTARLVNRGDQPASFVSFGAGLPEGVTFETASPADACGFSFGAVICSLSSFPAGATLEIVITVTPTVAGDLVFDASASTQGDVNLQNNFATLPVSIIEF